MRRYARVGTAVGGLAARVAGERYLGWNLNKGEHASELRQALGGLKGPLMKVAQIISTVPDALPKEYVNELSHLQADAPPMGWPFVKRRMILICTSVRAVPLEATAFSSPAWWSAMTSV